MTCTAIGHERDSGRAVFLAQSERIEELAGLISVPCRRFVLLLAQARAEAHTPAHLTGTMERLLDGGCVYLCTWGSVQAHDAMDLVVLERELKDAPEKNVVTTWHFAVPLAEAVEFALRRAQPDEALSLGWEAIVLAAVGDAGWAEAVRAAAMPYVLEPAA